MRTDGTRSLLLILAALVLVACGGGGGGGGGPSTRSVALPSDPDLDGCLNSEGGGAWPWQSGYVHSYTGLLYLGGEYLFGRQFYTFHLAGIPAGATVDRATLRLYQTEVVGDPYGSFGDVYVDHVHFEVNILSAYYDGNTYARDIGTLSTSAALGTRELVVTSQVRNDLSDGRTRSQFRVRFDSPSLILFDGLSDLVRFTDAEGSSGDTTHPPVLIVEFTVP